MLHFLVLKRNVMTFKRISQSVNNLRKDDKAFIGRGQKVHFLSFSREHPPRTLKKKKGCQTLSFKVQFNCQLFSEDFQAFTPEIPPPGSFIITFAEVSPTRKQAPSQQKSCLTWLLGSAKSFAYTVFNYSSQTEAFVPRIPLKVIFQTWTHSRVIPEWKSWISLLVKPVSGKWHRNAHCILWETVKLNIY